MAKTNNSNASCASQTRQIVNPFVDEPDLPVNRHATKYDHVYWEKTRRKWTAQAEINGKKYNLGSYDTDHEAYIAYLNWRMDNPENDRSMWTHKSRPFGKCKYKGVSIDKRVKSSSRVYKAAIRKGGIRKHIGMYATAEEAARAYDKVAKEWFGPDAYQNFPEGH